MARDIPGVVPDSIAQLIYERWGDMKSFSVAIGLPYTSVYSVLVKSGHRPLITLQTLAKPLSISIDDLANILVIPDMVLRKSELSRISGGKSLNQWAREAQMYPASVSKVVNNLEQTQISNLLVISKALDLDLKRFSECYSYSEIAS